MKPTLWRVSRYSRPGLPSPTISFMAHGGLRQASASYFFFFSSSSFSVLPFLMTSGSAVAAAAGAAAALGRRRGRLLGLRHHDVHEHRFAIGHGLPLRVAAAMSSRGSTGAASAR